MTFSGNYYLSKSEMTINANYIMSEFLNRGWTKESIAGMLGNMETESTINPGIWQNLQDGNLSGGFGLTQWTPATKLIEWAVSNNLDYKDIDTQIERIAYEVNNTSQWIPTSEYPMSFYEYTQSTEYPEILASVFLKNYERAGVEKESERREQAVYWYELLDGSGGGGKPCFPTSPESVITSPWGWRELNGQPDFHAGTDFASPSGTSQPIYATQSGVVIQSGWLEGGGYTVTIKHTGDPYYSRYMHMVTDPMVSVGQTVNKCELIGHTGDTGHSYGIHLHFEIAPSEQEFGKSGNTIDPEIYLQMDFGGGDDGSYTDIEKDLITLLMVDALNGWKY